MKYLSLLLLLLNFNGFAQITAPDEYLNYPLGTYFTRHHQVVDYFHHLASESSGRMQIEKYGSTNENRDLILAYISTPENIARIDEIRKNHENLSDEKVAIVWLSYNVHGNESSATEASMLTAFELLDKGEIALENVLVIIDPCLNPDGRDRYVNWYNQENGLTLNPNSSGTEHNEPWPGGRVNHYLFDLNRDWAWLTQIESQNRMQKYNEWQPHIHVDFHEQGINAPYYFAPAAEPMHEVISAWQKEFQTEIGRNHAKYFDQNGWLYFTREEFDLLYPSYGDTYPTYVGAIGMTYEQGGSTRAGLGVINKEGDTLTLYDRIIHHTTTGLSTIEMTMKGHQKLIEEFKNFVTKDECKYKTFAVHGDRERMYDLIRLLNMHDIKYTIGNGGNVSGFVYSKNKNGSAKTDNGWILINTNQRKGKLVNVLFEPKTKLNDSLTYDITAWSLPYAYGLECIASENHVEGSAEQYDLPMGHRSGESQYAYLIPWNSMSDARILGRLLQSGVKVRFAEEGFRFGKDKYDRGTLIIITTENKKVDVDALIPAVCNEFNADYGTCTTGMVDEGKDFGSGSVKLISKKRVALLTGDGCSTNRVGEIWHYFEHDLKYPLTRLQAESVHESTLEDFDVLILPSGWYNVSKEVIQSFTRNGGVVIAMEGDAHVNGELQEKELEDSLDEEKDTYAHKTYADKDREFVNEEITGAIYKCRVDNTHPLAFGYSDTYYTLKLSSTAYHLLEEGDNVVFLEEDAEQLSGFVGSAVKDAQSESLIFGVEEMGRGTQVYMIDNPIFRGFWENGKLFLANAVFFLGN